MEDWKKSEKTFSLACNLERASGMMQNTCVKIEHVTKRFGKQGTSMGLLEITVQERPSL